MVGRKRAIGTTRAKEEEMTLEEERTVKNAKIMALEREERDRDEVDTKNVPESKVLIRAIDREFAVKLARITKLEKELSEKEVAIKEKENNLKLSTQTFKTILSLKNQKIKDLQRVLADKNAKEVIRVMPCDIFSHDVVSIRTIFIAMSAVENEGVVSSRIVTSERCEWSFHIRKTTYQLGAYLSAGPLKGSRSSLRAYAKFRFLSHEDLSVLHEYTYPYMASFEVGTKWGKNAIISLQQLFDANEKFLKNDSIIVEALIKEIDVSE